MQFASIHPLHAHHILTVDISASLELPKDCCFCYLTHLPRPMTQEGKLPAGGHKALPCRVRVPTT